jgi:thymidylate synthase (FAD)
MYLRKPGWKTTRMGLTPWEDVIGQRVLEVLELEGRKCYKTEGKIEPGSCVPFMEKRMREGHVAILDHLHITAEYVCDRGVSHEWLRHKLTEILPNGCVRDEDDFAPMAAMQESTRYCNYMKSGGVCFIIPPWIDIPEGEYSSYEEIWENIPKWKTRTDDLWFKNALYSEYTYLEMLKEGLTPQQARGDLLIKVKTEFSVTCSITEWLHVMEQRTADAAHPQMRELMRPQLMDFKSKIPILFDHINW